MEFVYMTNETTGGSQEVSTEPGVVEHFEARGWVRAERPEETPFVPSSLAPDAVQNTEFIRLYHPVVNSFHDFPNNPEAIEGAYESGWVFQEEEAPKNPPSEDSPEESVTEPAKPVKRKSKSDPDGPAVASKE